MDTFIISFPIEHYDRRDAENIENLVLKITYKDRDKHLKNVNYLYDFIRDELFKTLGDRVFKFPISVWTMSDFADTCNDTDADEFLDTSWITYIHLVKDWKEGEEETDEVSVEKVVVNVDMLNKQYTVSGLPSCPTQTIPFLSIDDEWNCVKDYEGKPRYDINIWDDSEIEETPHIAIQYVELVKCTEKEGYLSYKQTDAYKLVDELNLVNYDEWVDIERKEEIERILMRIFNTSGMDKPSNFEEILEFVDEDVCVSAHPIRWSDGDVVIGFRRWIECASKIV